MAGVFAWLFTRMMGRRWGAITAAIVIALYTLLVGAGASVVRAALMAGVGLLGAQLGRRQSGANSLAFVAALMCLGTPDLLWDVSFQLSFAATLGLVLYAQPLQDGFVLLIRRFAPGALALRLGEVVGANFLFTLAAQATTLPVMIYHFQHVSLVSLLANPLVLPAQPAVEILAMLATLAGLVYLPLGQAAAYIAWPFVAYTNRVVEWLAIVPQRAVNLGQLSLIVAVCLYLILFSATLAQSWRSALRRVLNPTIVISITAVAAILAWRALFSLPDGRLHLTMLSSGPPATFLIQSPSGHALLVNGGADSSQLKTIIDQRLPFFARKLDAVVIASTQKNAILALPAILDAVPCNMALWCAPANANQSARQLSQVLTDLSVGTKQVGGGESLDLGDGARLRVLAAGANGAVLMLEWRSFRALLPFPMAADTPLALVNEARPQPVSLLLLAGHGEAVLNPAGWLSGLQPQLILASLDAGDPKSKIDAKVLEALKGFPILTGSDHGWIEVSTDGENMWVTTER